MLVPHGQDGHSVCWIESLLLGSLIIATHVGVVVHSASVQ